MKCSECQQYDAGVCEETNTKWRPDEFCCRFDALPLKKMADAFGRMSNSLKTWG